MTILKEKIRLIDYFFKVRPPQWTFDSWFELIEEERVLVVKTGTGQKIIDRISAYIGHHALHLVMV